MSVGAVLLVLVDEVDKCRIRTSIPHNINQCQEYSTNTHNSSLITHPIPLCSCASHKKNYIYFAKVATLHLH